MNKEQPQPEIKKMPTKETLQKFLQGFHGEPTVIFDSEKGEFTEVRRPTPPEHVGNAFNAYD